LPPVLQRFGHVLDADIVGVFQVGDAGRLWLKEAVPQTGLASALGQFLRGGVSVDTLTRKTDQACRQDGL